MTRLFFLFFLLLTAPAQAYVGPGPGLSMLSSLITLIGGIFLALFMIVFYPLRLFLKKRKQQPKADEDKGS
jgi:hypothetical protein